MKVVYSHDIFSLQRYGGISRYFVEVAKRVNLLARVKILGWFHINEYLKFAKIPNLKSRYIDNGKTIFFRTRVLYWINQSIQSLQLIFEKKCDVYHISYYGSNIQKNRKYKVVLTVYDMIHEIYPSYFDKSDKTAINKKNALDNADHVICISESTKKDLIRFCQVSENKISVVYLGFEFAHKKDEELSTGSDLHNRPYILFVGQRAGYKNFSNLIQAYSKSQFLKQNYTIVCFGGGSLTANEKEQMNEMNLNQDQIIFMSGDDHLLVSLYKGAAIFVYPSLYEGFGIPPLEAMSCGCPVVCSNTSSIPEVVGDAAIMFDPLSVDSISNAIILVLQNDEIKRELIAKGFRQIKKFSWDNCANEHLKIYSKLINNSQAQNQSFL